jgi:ABC-2 type transport system permease protein
MLVDVRSVFWREWRQHMSQFDERRRFVVGLAVSALFLIGLEVSFGIHRQISEAHPALLIWIWCWLPLGSAVTLSTDTIAGERERHTLETLLSTRLPERAILTGKALSIALHSWLSALALALGVLVALNAVTLWSGTLVTYPLSVLVLGPLVSLLLTLLGTLAAILFSMRSPTVRQANMRILLVTSVLPILLIVPVSTVVIMVVVGLAVLSQMTDFQFGVPSISQGAALTVLVLGVALSCLIAAIALVYIVTAMRFKRERLMRPIASGSRNSTAADAPAAASRGRPATGQLGEARLASPFGAFTVDRGTPAYDPAESEALVVTILRDARVVIWKELAEARGMAREWRGWLILTGIVISSMVLQVSAFASWFWAQGSNFSLLFWLAMAASLPILIAQRAADAVAGERERHTGEILFTTRLSDAGILVGKLSVVALLPWCVTLAIPLTGLVVTNLMHAADGPYLYPPGILLAGTVLTLAIAIVFASVGMLMSIGAPTVQHAARRISWFLMPILIAPGLGYRSSLWTSATDSRPGSLPESGIAGMLASGELLRYLLLGLPLLVTATVILVYILWRRFSRGDVVFD